MCEGTSTKKQTYLCEILSVTHLNDQVFTLSLKRPAEMGPIEASQFFNLKASEMPYLRRPISISRFDETSFDFTIIVKGEGTKGFQAMKAGQFIDVQGPLGNTYTISPDLKKVLIVGGGIGVPPQAVLAEAVKARTEAKIVVQLGFRNEPYLLERFHGIADQLTVASEGGFGDYKGYVTDLVERALDEAKAEGLPFDQVFVCGPHVVIEKVAKLCNARGVVVQLLMEERMACGIGACMVCTCKIKDETMPEGYWNKRVCKDGPVFLGTEVIFDA